MFHELVPLLPSDVAADEPTAPPLPVHVAPIVTLNIHEVTIGVTHTRTLETVGYLFERAILPLAIQASEMESLLLGSAWHVLRESDGQSGVVAVDFDLPEVDTDLPREERHALAKFEVWGHTKSKSSSAA